jgi:hypothetical protein
MQGACAEPRESVSFAGSALSQEVISLRGVLVEIVIDNLVIYAHIDEESGEAVVAQGPEATPQELGDVYRTLVKRGYCTVRASWFDADWGRDLHVLEKQTS